MKGVFVKISVLALIAVATAGFFTIRYALERLDERASSALLNKRVDVSVTIVEGKRREEIAAELEKKGICSAKDFLAASKGSEGYLFPDTYRFYPNTPASEVVSTLKSTFTKRTQDVALTSDQVTLASIIEREAQNDAERASIAGVYSNRLAIGMKLDSDPTVQYAKDSLNYTKAGMPTSFSFWSEITRDDYTSVQSAYNTYISSGLPPSPISNPGLASLKAAANPEKNPYYFFFHRNGQIYLSKTLDEQTTKLRNVPRS
jgi:UPF0755 protein